MSRLHRSRSSSPAAAVRVGFVLALALALAGCRANRPEATAEVVELVRQGQYEEAHALAAELAADEPDDAARKRLVVDTEVALRLDLGRRFVFAGDGEKALEVFGDVRDRDYYTFTMRFEAIEQAYLGLLNNPAGMAPQP